MSFRGGLTSVGRAAIQGASPQSLELGIAKVGSGSLATHTIDETITDVAGTLQVTKPIDEIFYTPFGADRLVIFIDLRMEEAMDIGNVVFFLADGVTPIAYGVFERILKKVAKGPDNGGDWVTLALSLQSNDILEKFDLTAMTSTEYSMEIQATEVTAGQVISEFSRITTVFDKLTNNLNIPAVAYAGDKWYVDPFFFSVFADFSTISGGVIGDLYDRTPPTSQDLITDLLFADSELGAVYDPSDLTSLFQETTGITNVTADAQSVGVMLDKSRIGKAPAAEWLADPSTSNLFNSGTAAVSGDTEIVSPGVFRVYSSAGSLSFIQTAAALTVGKIYYVKFTIDSIATLGGGLRVQDGGAIFNSTGPKSSILVATSTSAFIKRVSGVTDIQISGVEFYEVPGYHAIAPSDAARPLYKTDGTLHWLEPDGTNDFMNIHPALNLGEEWAHIGGWQSNTVLRRSFGLQSDGYRSLIHRDIGGWYSWHNEAGTSSPVVEGDVTVPHIVAVEQGDNTEINMRLNQEGGTEIDPYNASGTPGLVLFSDRNGSWLNGFSGKFFGGVWLNRNLGSYERELTENYFAHRTGISFS